jgi:DNA-binding MarR family transcriptional regulator
MNPGSIPRLQRAAHAVGLYIASLPDLDLNQAEAHVLAHLHAGPARISDLHAAFGHRRSTLTSLLDRLEARGFVARSVDESDRRSVRVSLTPAGRKVAAAAHRALLQAEAKALTGFSKAEVDAFGRIADAFAALARD